MTVLDRPRQTSPGPTTGGQGRWGLRLRAAGAGASAAVLGLLVVCLPSLLVWVASPQSSVPWTTAFGIGAHVWLLAHTVDLSAGTATISLVPLLLGLLPVSLAVVACRRVLALLDDARPARFQMWGALRKDVADVWLGFTGAYAVTGLLVSLIAGSAHVRSNPVEGLLATAVVAAGSSVLAVALEFRGHLPSVAPDLADRLRAVLPPFVRKALRPALWGAVAGLLLGGALVVAVAVVHAQRVGQLYSALAPGVVGGTVLSLVQLLALPNFALWGLSWMAGPGFAVANGSAVTWTHSDPGLLPLVPVLGALPDPGPMPAMLRLAVLGPVLVGALVAWRSIRQVTRLASWQAKAKVAAAACVIAALLLAAGTWLADGSLGSRELSTVGADPVLAGLCLLGEMLLGAALVVGASQWRAHGWQVRR
ncbi:cell division protein PerM [Oryzihumus sp.]